MVQPLTPWPSTEEAMRVCVAARDRAGVRKLLEAGFWANCPVHLKDEYLQLALLNEDRKMVQLLITWGAPVTLKMLMTLPSRRLPRFEKILRGCGVRLGALPQIYIPEADETQAVAVRIATDGRNIITPRNWGRP